jgi:tetratricopeptide (TPR) repeat protein
MIKKLIVVALLIISFTGHGQMDYSKQYANAKDLFKQGKYNLAMESFKPLIAYDRNNPYSAYASFYFAVAAYHQEYKAVAKDMLNQIKTTHADWDKLNEVNFWLGKIHFDNKDYFQGLKVFQSLQDKTLEDEIKNIKASALAGVTDVETLRMMHEEYPKDAIIGERLAIVLSRNLVEEKDRKELEDLINKFKLKKSEFLPEAPKTFHKDKYAVSVLFPFMVNTIEPTTAKKRNQILIDFYEGMKLAVDTLNKEGSNISLRVYDTERSADKLKRVLGTEEVQTSDLIIGPFFPEENKLVQDFSLANKVNTVHPFANNTDIIGNNPYAFLFQPSSETIGKKTAEFLADRTRRKTTMVFYGPTKKDSILAANFSQTAAEKGLKVVLSHRVQNRETKKILDILAKPTEFDEFKYPSQFTLKKDSIGSIYVATDDALIYAEVVSAAETRGDSIKVVGSENWLDDSAIALEKYQSLGIVLTAPNFANPTKSEYNKFFNRFVAKYGRTPSAMARMGYECMMFYGNQLKESGVYFQDALAKKNFIPGSLSEGFNYQFTRSNAVVPFITFQNGTVRLVDKK